MVKLSLSNQKDNVEPRQVIVDVGQGLCELNNGQTITVARLFELSDFSHPLLQERVKLRSDNNYRYQYQNIEEMLNIGRYVYSVLLRAKDPSKCNFIIEPGRNFKPNYPTGNIHFSAKSSKVAEDKITVEQFNQLIKQFGAPAFKYCESILIYEDLSLSYLPESINGDALYEKNEQSYELLYSPPSYDNCEFRYIDPIMGLGVFAREPIKKGDVVGIYTGVKSQTMDMGPSYVFVHDADCFNLHTDSLRWGNITRFINHADYGRGNGVQSNATFLTPNLTAYHSTVYGLGIVVYKAHRDITQGEQLLVNYGQSYFTFYAPRRFNKRGELRDIKKLLNMHPKYSQYKLHQMRLLAQCGIKQASQYLWNRTVSVITLVVVLTYLINYLG